MKTIYIKMSNMSSNYEKVKEFTVGSGFPVPDEPRAMTRESVEFIIRMVFDECAELLSTVARDDEDVLGTLEGLIGTNYKKLPKPVDDRSKIMEQADGLVDIIYYVYNSATKHGMDIDKVFDVVHNANMAKRFPDGQFHRDASGKIIKPPGWKEGDITDALFK